MLVEIISDFTKKGYEVYFIPSNFPHRGFQARLRYENYNAARFCCREEMERNKLTFDEYMSACIEDVARELQLAMRGASEDD